MIEIISSLALSIGKFLLSIFVIKNIDLDSKFGISLFLGIMGIKNILLFVLAVYLPKYLNLDNQKFLFSFMASYFLLLIFELIIIAKMLNKKNTQIKVKVDE